MKATIKWMDEVTFEAKSESGHTVTIDGPPSEGGRNKGMRPMELVLIGTAGCTSFDVISILRKSRQEVTDCVTEVEADRSDDVPSVFTRIHFHFVVTGTELKEKQVERAVKLSAEKYCSASIMLEKGGVAITHDYEIREG
jgi:putative redox protein